MKINKIKKETWSIFYLQILLPNGDHREIYRGSTKAATSIENHNKQPVSAGKCRAVPEWVSSLHSQNITFGVRVGIFTIPSSRIIEVLLTIYFGTRLCQSIMCVIFFFFAYKTSFCKSKYRRMIKFFIFYFLGTCINMLKVEKTFFSLHKQTFAYWFSTHNLVRTIPSS